MFSEPQVKALSSKLSAKHVRTRQHSGLTLSYIEGWHTIAEANRIFGYDAWDRQTMAVKCVWEGMKGNRSACSYIARVRVRVRAGEATRSAGRVAARATGWGCFLARPMSLRSRRRRPMP